MLEKPQILRTSSRDIAIIRLTVPRAEIQRVMDPGRRELLDAVAAQGIALDGPWFTHHLTLPGETFDFEIAVPVAAPIAPAGRVQPGRLRAATVARALYRGPYEGLGAAWGELGAWIAAQGHTPDADLWECYVSGPESGPDPSHWLTELNRPLSR